MGNGEEIKNDITDILKIYNECNNMCFRNQERIRNIIENLKDLEQQHCKIYRTYCDCETVLGDLLEKENDFICKMGKLISQAALINLEEKCARIFKKC